MKRDAWRFHHQRQWRLFVEVECRLMRRRGSDRRHGAGPADLDRAMDMTAQHAFDVVVPPDDFGKPVAALPEVKGIERLDAATERRMMHEQDRRAVAFLQACFAPAQTLPTQPPET